MYLLGWFSSLAVLAFSFGGGCLLAGNTYELPGLLTHTGVLLPLITGVVLAVKNMHTRAYLKTHNHYRSYALKAYTQPAALAAMILFLLGAANTVILVQAGGASLLVAWVFARGPIIISITLTIATWFARNCASGEISLSL